MIKIWILRQFSISKINEIKNCLNISLVCVVKEKNYILFDKGYYRSYWLF